MGAITTVYQALLGNGAHLVSHDALYGPARGVVESIYKRFGVEYTYLDATVTEDVRKAIRPNTKMIYIETPANPTMGIMDIPAIAAIAREHGIPLIVDNTFCSPYLQNPIAMGADVVIHSMTKFINGHADIVAGMIVAAKEDMYDRLRSTMINMGCNMDPHQAYLVLRGFRTLGIRIERAQANAMELALFLENHPKIENIRYPGLPSHPQYELATRQMRGPGTMISFEVKGGYEAGKILMDHVQLAILAVSLGGIETLIQHPASMTHSKLPRESRIEAGITDGLVRLSVGIEDVEDIRRDLEQALGQI
jgi:methionine-gamma-lyase